MKSQHRRALKNSAFTARNREEVSFYHKNHTHLRNLDFVQLGDKEGSKRGLRALDISRSCLYRYYTYPVHNALKVSKCSGKLRPGVSGDQRCFPTVSCSPFHLLKHCFISSEEIHNRG